MNGVSVQMVFSPQTCNLERLEATLTPDRRALADRILAQAQQSVATRASYNNLIVGPRGAGKTHVVAYIRRRIEAQTAESIALNVISLAEEERGIASVADFVVACLRGAGVPSDDIIARVAGDPATVRERAFAFFAEVTDAKPTWIILENLSDVFGRLAGDPLDDLRSFLQEHAFVSLLGSSVQLFEDSSRADHPFYGYFCIHPLKGLDAEGARGYLRLLAQANADADLAAALGRKQAQARVNAIYHLTGGNHRLLAMLSIFLTADGLTELVGPFLEMADRELTPYYQQRLDRLAPQQYKIVQAIAEERGQALSVNEIARRLPPITPQAVSRQLHDLLHAGFVQRQPVGRESFYDLHEPLLRIVLDMKTGRDQPLPLIVDLLKQWYQPHELRDLEAHAGDSARVYYRMALAETERRDVQEAIGERVLVPIPGASGLGVAGDQVSAVLREAAVLVTQGKFAEALEKVDQLLTVQPHHGCALVIRAGLLGACGRHEEALAASEEFLARLGDRERPQPLQLVAGALLNKGIALVALERSDEALAAYEEVVRRFGESDQPAMFEPVAMALVSKGVVLWNLRRGEDAVAVYDEVVRQFGESDQPALLKAVATALFNKGVLLEELGRPEEALAAYDEVVRRFGEGDQPALLEQVAKALLNEGLVLGDLGHPEEALATCEEVVRRFGESDQPALLELVAKALVNKGSQLRLDSRREQALSAYEAALVIRPDDRLGRPFRAQTLFELGRHTEALSEAREILGSPTREPSDSALLALLLLEVAADDARDLREVREAFGGHEEALVGGLTAWVQNQLPMSDERARKLEQAETALRSVFEDVPEARPLLDILGAARRDALGDKKALLTLPVELRRLIEQAKEGGDNDTPKAAPYR